MKTNLLLTGALLCSSLALQAQNVEEKISNPGFETSLTGWTNSSNNFVTRLSNGPNEYKNYARMKRNNQAGTAITMTASLIGVNPTEGYIKVKFDLRMYRNTNTPSFSVQLASGSSYTTYLTINKSSATTITTTTGNNAILSYGIDAMPNEDFRTITLLIPRTSAYTGNLRFSYTPNNTDNYADLDNISVTSLNSNPVSCPNCYFTIIEDANGEIDYNESAPVPVCKPEDPTDNIYYYYLPAIAAQPSSLDADNENPPAQIQVTTELSQANISIKSTTGTVLATGTVTNSVKYSYTTPINKIFTNTFKTPYSTQGYIIESNQPVTVRWRLNNNVNRMQVVLRGQSALGNAFRLASVLNSTDDASPNGAHYYTVMATENATKVQIGNPSVPSSITTFTLNKGQQYTDTFMRKSVSGMLVLTDKPVVVASGQQHRKIYNGSTSLEGTVLQVAPFRTLGKEYVAISTEGYSGFQVVAVENGTSVYRDGVLVTILNGGESHQVYNLLPTSSLYGKPTRISTSKPAYVYELGSNSIGEFELYPAPPVDQPVGKAGKIIYDKDHGDDGWVIVNTADASKLRRNGSATLNYTHSWDLPASGSLAAKKVYYWNNNFAPIAVNEITCTNCDGMYVGQLNDGESSGAQVGYISSFSVDPIQFFNTEFLPAELLTNGYVYDSVNYYTSPPATISHTVTIASSGGGNVTIDSIHLSRTSGNTNTGNVQSINGLSFVLNIPPASSVSFGLSDTVNTTVYVTDAFGNKAALCLSYLLRNDVPLPVTLSNFEVRKSGEEAVIEWETSKEHNNKGFMIQRSADSRDWQDLAWVDAQSTVGQQDLSFTYSHVDSKPLTGQNYYRLKQVDVDMNFNLSKIRSLFFHKEAQSIQVHPNPANTYANIEGLSGNYKLKLVDIMGRVILEENISNSDTYRLDISKLSNGAYAIGLLDEHNEWHFVKLQVFK